MAANELKERKRLGGNKECHGGGYPILTGIEAEYWHRAVTERPQTIGRSRSCDIVIAHDSVSRLHAQIWRESFGVFIRDCSSRNGTYVNGCRVVESPVNLGSSIRLGSVALTLVAAPDGNAVAEENETRNTSRSSMLQAPTTKGDNGERKLSPSQKSVMELILEGLSEKAIATRLHISPHTAHVHIQKIYRIFDVHSRPELMALLRRDTHFYGM